MLEDRLVEVLTGDVERVEVCWSHNMPALRAALWSLY